MNIHLKTGQVLYADEIKFVARPAAGEVILRALDYQRGSEHDYPLGQIESIIDGQTEDNANQQ